jgi:para-nitrobenzyl esterase
VKPSLICAMALSFAAAGALLAAATTLRAAEPIKVKIDSGTLVGAADKNVEIFRGIPYAAPPVGALRWAPPQHPVAWTSERAATSVGASCLQSSAGGAPNAGGTLTGAEDCLYLNVFAPTAAKKAPVMVWIHGGYNTAGSGSSLDGTEFAKDGVIVVTINYRLGAMGFFAHPALTKEAKANQPLANFALMDQLESLRWVKRNIAAFGGDPANVTVFGESAGAMDIFALLGAQESQGLFTRAIMESNIGWGTAQTEAAKETGGVQLAAGLGLTGDAVTPTQLRALPADKVMAAQNRASTTIDGRMVMESTFDAFKNGHQVKVPTLVGSNSYEASLIARNPGVTPQQIATYSDQNGAGPARWIAAHQAASGQPAYLYFFSYVREAQRATAPGAAHASEIPFVFNNFTPRAGQQAVEPSAQDKAMGALMHSCWVAFAKTGTPTTCAKTAAWPQYTAANDQLMEFSVDTGVRSNFHKTTLDPIEARQTASRTTGVAAR